MTFGAAPLSTTVIGTNQVPVASAAEPGVAGGTLTALEGGGGFVDSNGNRVAPVVVEDIERAGYVAATTPPTATSAGADTPYTFSAQVNRVIVQNNTSGPVYFAFDTPASLGSLVLLPGSLMSYPKKCTVFHLYTTAVQNINGTAVGGIVVLGAN